MEVVKYKKEWLIIPIVLAVALLGLIYNGYKKMPKLPTLVYLIPDGFSGAVFVFFDQPDGQALQVDPLGRAVLVPENGIVKIKEKARDVVGENVEPTHRAEQWVAISEDGVRRILKYFAGSYPSDDPNDSSWWEGYIDENNRLHKFVSDPNKRGPFYYMSKALRNERMVFGNEGCADQFPPIYGKTTACGRFLIASPNERLTLPKWEWEDLLGHQTSIAIFEHDANARLFKHKELQRVNSQVR